MAAEQPMGASTEQNPRIKKKRRWVRVVAVLAVVVLVALALAPSLAGGFVPGYVEKAAAGKIAGGVKISKVSLSWLGRQNIGPIVVTDPAKPEGKNEIARLNVECDAGLLGLATGALGSTINIGTLKISGQGDIVRGVDGVTNLQRALAPKAGAAQPSTTPPSTTPKPSEPARLPKGIKGRVLIDKLDLAFSDDANPNAAVKIKDLVADTTLTPPSSSSGMSAVVKLTTKAVAAQGEGAIKVDAKLDSITDAKGVLKPDNATIDATISADALPTPLLDALANMKGKLAAGLGPTLKLDVTAKGTVKAADANLKAASQGLNADATVKIADNVLTSTAPITVNLTGNAVRALADLDATLAKAGTLTLAQTPDAAVVIDGVKFKIPTGGQPLDLRGSSANIMLKTGQASGTVALQPGAAPSAFSVAPMELNVSAPDFADKVTVAGSTRATIGSQPAGVLTINAVASGLLDKNGTPVKGVPGSLDASATLRGVATAIAQPFVAGLKVDLPQDVGPTLDLDLKAQSAASGGPVPNLNLDLGVKSAKLNGGGGFALADGVLKSRDQGFTLTADAGGAIASRLVAPDTGWQVHPRGRAVVFVKDLDVPLTAGNHPQIDKAAAKADITLEGIALSSVKNGVVSAPIDINSFTASAALAPAAAPTVNLKSAMQFENQPFTLTGAFELRNLLATGPSGLEITAMKARPVGSLEIANIPTSVMKIVQSDAPPRDTRLALAETIPGTANAVLNAQPNQPVKPAPNLARVVAETLGQSVTLKLKTAQAAAKDPLDISLLVDSADRDRVGLAHETVAKLSDTQLDVSKCGTRLLLSPGGFDAVMGEFSPETTPRPRLRSTSKVLLIVDPITVPLKPGTLSPDLSKVATATVNLSTPGASLIEGLTQKNDDGTARNLAPVGVQDLKVKAGIPAAAALPAVQAWSQPMTLEFSTGLITAESDPQPQTLLRASGTGKGTLVGGPGKPAALDTLDLTANIKDVFADRIEAMLGRPGLVTGSIGGGMTVDSTVALRSFADPKTRTVELGAAVNSQRLKMAEPLKFSVLPDRLRADRPVKLTWTLDPSFANATFLAPKPGEAKAALSLAAPTTVNVDLSRLTLSSGENTGPLKPGVFDLALNAAVPAMDMTLADGGKVAFKGTNVVLNSGKAGPSASVAFDIGVNEVAYSAAGAPPSAKKLSFKGTADNLSDASGNLNADAATITATGDMPAVPTALLDALAKQDGLLVDALGPMASAQLKADRFGKSGGTLDLTATSPRASATVRGGVKDQVFVASEPIKMSLTEVTNQLAGRFIKGLPLVGSVSKAKTDEPAMITATGMQIPLDKDFRKLNGQIVIDPGQAKFETGKEFASILKLANQKTAGALGQKLEPIRANIASGVMTYERWSLPVGEFSFKTEGKVDLVNGTVDVVTYLPLGSLTDEAAGLFKKGKGLGNILGGAVKLEDTLMVPWRTKGAFGKTKTEPDLELFAKQAVESVKPEDLVKKGLDDLLNKKKDKK